MHDPQACSFTIMVLKYCRHGSLISIENLIQIKKKKVSIAKHIFEGFKLSRALNVIYLNILKILHKDPQKVLDGNFSYRCTMCLF